MGPREPPRRPLLEEVRGIYTALPSTARPWPRQIKPQGSDSHSFMVADASIVNPVRATTLFSQMPVRIPQPVLNHSAVVKSVPQNTARRTGEFFEVWETIGVAGNTPREKTKTKPRNPTAIRPVGFSSGALL